MPDSQQTAASEELEKLPVAPADDSSDNENEPTEDASPDLSKLHEEFQKVKAQTTSRAEIESLRRQAGHVPSLQKQVAELQAQIARYDSLSGRLDAYEQMLLDVLPTESVERVETQRQVRTTEELLDAKLKPILDKFETTEKPDEPDANTFAMWELEGRINAATAFVKAEATKVGVDPDSIPPEVWAGAQQKHGLDLEAATLEVLKFVNEQAKKGSASDRRAERKAAAEGGSPSERAGAMGQYDMTTLKGAAQARKDGAITPEQFMEVFRRVQSGR